MKSQLPKGQRWQRRRRWYPERNAAVSFVLTVIKKPTIHGKEWTFW
jgi:hypothetical protein